MLNKFYEKYWSNKTIGHLDDFDLKWPKLKKHIPKDKNIVILDFGCGKGAILGEMMKINPEARYIGLDVSKAALAEAKKNLNNVEFFEINDGGPIPLKDKSVDFIFSSEVVEHIYDVENAVQELSRVIKSGGSFLLTTPYHGFVKNLLISIIDFDKHFNPLGSHVRFFSKKTLFSLLEKNGFEIVTYGYYGRFYPIPNSIFALAKKK